VGALIGALMIASLGSRKIRGKLITLASVTLPLTMLIFSISSWIPVSVLAMAGIGWSLIMSTNVSNALVQTSVPEAIRGRVMGIFTLILFGGNPIGSLVVGNSASFFTERIAVMANTVVLVLFAVFLWLRRPFIRKLE
jgi:MFS family permease